MPRIFAGGGSAVVLSAIGPYVSEGKLTFKRNELLKYATTYFIDTSCPDWEDFKSWIEGTEFFREDLVPVTDPEARKKFRDYAEAHIDEFICTSCDRLEGNQILPVPELLD